MQTLEIDIETFSSINLNKSGVYRYIEANDFEILLFGYSVDGGEIQVVDLSNKEKVPDEITNALTDPFITKWAYNSNFERICLSRWLGLPTGRYLDPKSWRCTMIWSAYMGLPLSLEGTGAVLGLQKQKLTEGKDLIRYFCTPCKPSNSNDQRIKNLPIHAPEKWAAFKKYNLRDVEVEMAVKDKLSKFPVPDSVWAEYHLDQEINDRGVALDMEFVSCAIEADKDSRSKLLKKMETLTALDNPNSVQQLKEWLADNGLETDTLGKKAVAEMLNVAPKPLKEVLELRQQLAKSSIKKYQAMENAVCKDNRARGMFFFYGANRTGRYSGRNIQLQNLPQNHIPDLEQARSLVRNGNITALEMLYDSVPEVLSELIRTAFVPKNGHKFIVADFSSIERVVLAWLAGEKWVLDAYSTKKDLYTATASQMFNVPIEGIDKKSPLRQKGKVADLACIAEGQLVLTNLGLVPIENVTTNHRLWDGVNWVSHEGVIFKGEGEVITYDGLTATPDHIVWIEGKSEPIQFREAAACSAHLTQTGYDRKKVRLGENNIARKTMEQKNESLLCVNKMCWLREYSVANPKKSSKRKIQGMPKLLSAKADSILDRSQINRCKTKVRKSQKQSLSQLWGKRYKIRFPKCNGSRFVSYRQIWTSFKGIGDRQNKQQLELRKRQYSICNSFRKQSEQKMYGIKPFFTGILALCKKRCYTEIISRDGQRRNSKICKDSSFGKKEKLENHKRKARLYDIRNAGQYNRFTVSGKLVHNCGYGGSVGALKAMGALEMGLTEEELKPLVTGWRAANPNIVRFWWDVDRAAIKAVKDRTITETHGIRFSYQSGMLFITLPSGRRLTYVKPRIGTNQFDSECVTYEGVGGTKKWEQIQSYGPKFVENIVQAISRDILCYALENLKHYSIVMHIHDEIVIEAEQQISVESICNQMSQTPPWAKGLLLRAAGYETYFYCKD